MTKRLILAFVFLSWHLVACSNGDSGISSGLPDKPSAEEDSPGTETISEEMRVKITGEDLYISAKLDAKTDILYWFKKCFSTTGIGVGRVHYFIDYFNLYLFCQSR